MKNSLTHSFVICAYKESPYLEDCIISLLNQRNPSAIVITTSTPNQHINNIANKYNLNIFVNSEKSGIGHDWNFALSQVTTDFVTIAHQDDIYLPEYSEYIKNNISSDTVLFFTDYGEIRADKEIFDNILLNTKRKLNIFLKNRIFRKNKFIRRRSMSFGCAICCPTVCININRFPNFRFDEKMTVCLDWDAWERLSKENGEFIYIPTPLLLHRIHQNSETTAQLEAGNRQQEDFEMLCRFWPKKIAEILLKQYSKSEKSNILD